MLHSLLLLKLEYHFNTLLIACYYDYIYISSVLKWMWQDINVQTVLIGKLLFLLSFFFSKKYTCKASIIFPAAHGTV